MKHSSLLIFAVFTLGLYSLVAADFWKEKKYTEWSEKELDKMLENSPWAQKTSIQMKARGGGGRGGGLSTGLPGAESQGGGAGGAGRGGRGSFEDTERPPEIRVIVRWHTALPIKQAIACLRYQDEVETSEEAVKMLGQEEPLYIVGIIGIPGPAAALNLDEVKAGAQLKIKNLPPIQAANAQADQGPTGTNLYLVFPRLQEGAHIITAEDKEVEVFLKTSTIEVKHKFKLKDMVYRDQLEL